jgi:hypothetical protein
LNIPVLKQDVKLHKRAHGCKRCMAVLIVTFCDDGTLTVKVVTIQKYSKRVVIPEEREFLFNVNKS